MLRAQDGTGGTAPSRAFFFREASARTRPGTSATPSSCGASLYSAVVEYRTCPRVSRQVVLVAELAGAAAGDGRRWCCWTSTGSPTVVGARSALCRSCCRPKRLSRVRRQLARRARRGPAVWLLRGPRAAPAAVGAAARLLADAAPADALHDPATSGSPSSPGWPRRPTGSGDQRRRRPADGLRAGPACRVRRRHDRRHRPVRPRGPGAGPPTAPSGWPTPATTALNRATVALIALRPDGSATLYRLTYPDGPHDAEALLLAPDGTPYIVTKEIAGRERVYRPAARCRRRDRWRCARCRGRPASCHRDRRRAGRARPGSCWSPGGGLAGRAARVALRTTPTPTSGRSPDADVAAALAAAAGGGSRCRRLAAGRGDHVRRGRRGAADAQRGAAGARCTVIPLRRRPAAAHRPAPRRRPADRRPARRARLDRRDRRPAAVRLGRSRSSPSPPLGAGRRPCAVEPGRPPARAQTRRRTLTTRPRTVASSPGIGS